MLFLDTETVEVSGSYAIKEPLIELMTRMMGPDDLVAVMTPKMSPSQLTFGRRTKVIEDGLRQNWIWGRRDSIILDEQERLYSDCYPPRAPGESVPSVLAMKMIERRRERLVLDSLLRSDPLHGSDPRGADGGDHGVGRLEALSARSDDDGAAGPAIPYRAHRRRLASGRAAG